MRNPEIAVKQKNKDRPLILLFSRAENGAAAHADHAALLIIALAFLCGAWLAANRFLNGDEAMNALWANMDSWRQTYENSTIPEHIHPPLYLVSLHFWRVLFGNSEFSLRLPSLLCAAGYLWLLYKWVKLRFNASAALTALIVLAFSPAVMTLGVEIRTYAALLFLMAAALYTLELAFARNSVRLFALYSLILCLSVLNSYSSIWFILAAHLYAFIRFLRRQLPLRMGVIWAALQLPSAVLGALLYFKHVRFARATGFDNAATTWLKASFMGPEESIPTFVVESTFSVFEYVLYYREASPIAALLFAAALALLLFQHLRRAGPEAPVAGWMLVVPAALASIASIANIAPYGASRHSIVAANFMVIGASYALSRIMSRRVLPVLVLGVVLTPIWSINARNAWYFPGTDYEKAAMTSVLQDMRLRIPADGHLFLDRQSCMIMKYYLGKDHADPMYVWKAPFPIRLGGYNLSCYMQTWSFSAKGFPGAVASARSRFDIHPSTPLWVFDAGWGTNLANDLRWNSNVLPLDLQWHGKGIALFRYSTISENAGRP